MFITYCGHRLTAVNCGLHDWRAFVDMFEVGVAKTQQEAIDVAKRWVNDALYQQHVRRQRTSDLLEAAREGNTSSGAVLRIAGGTDYGDGLGIGPPQDEFGQW